MKSLKNGTLFLLLASMASWTGCGQQLVEFIDASAQSGNDLSGTDMAAAQGDLANSDLSTELDQDGSATIDLGDNDAFLFNRPRVISVTPANLAMGVPVFRKPTATFNKAMNPSTINNASFT